MSSRATRVLAVDTASSSLGSISLTEGLTICCERQMPATQGYGQILFEKVEEVLAATGWTLADIDLFAATSGPGSFTGLRIGLSAMQGFAAACGKPARGVSNLRALAALGTGDLRAAVVDARRGEVYAAVYNASLQTVSSEVAAPLDRWWSALSDPKPETVLTSTLSSINWDTIGARVVERTQLASAAAQIAYKDALIGVDALGVLEANYVRRSDAELKWTDR